MKGKQALRIFYFWHVGAAAITVLALLIYVAVQQSYRSGANDPQIQIAEDTALSLESGAAILDQIPASKVDVAKSLKEFVIIYDTEGDPIAGNGYLGNSLLSVPKGVFEAAMARGENRVTLEPQKGTRIAAIAVPFVGREANGYALAGRNMREVEVREKNLLLTVTLAWAGALAVLGALAWIGKSLFK